MRAAATPPKPPPPAPADAAGSNRRGVIATIAAVVFLLTGSGLISVALATQRRAPVAPPLAVAADAPAPLGNAAPAPAPPPATLEHAESWWSTAASPRTPAPEAAAVVLPRSVPVALDIPAIDVHSDLLRLGQNPAGGLEVPAGEDYDRAAWYRHSPAPGSLGPSVLLGHVDSAANGPSVFFRLGELRRGDRVTVTRADGSAAVFVVDDVRRYAKDSFPTRLVYSDIDHAGLRILTCGGAFDDAAGHYLDNVVVFASLVDRTS